jgi:bacteriocin biosynthesis cyclodehydratase domain-containing protein
METNGSRYSLAPYCEALELDKTLHVGFGSVGLKIVDEFDKEFVYRLFSAVQRDRTIDPAFFENITDGQQSELLKRLFDHRLIVPTEQVPSYNRNHRDQLFYLMSGADPRVVAEDLETKSVCIIGCGGIGCMMALTLATAGVGEIILMDDDLVEIHNISRQFAYTEEDIGKKKVDVLAKEIKRRNSKIQLRTFDHKAAFSGGQSNVPAADFVVFSADQRGLMFPANEYFVQANQPFMHICYINDISVWGPLVVPGKTGCWHCQEHIGSDQVEGEPERSALLKAINGSYTCPVISPLSLIATSFAVLDVIKFLTGVALPISLNRRVGVWTKNLEIEFQDFRRNPNCRVCGAIPDSSNGNNLIADAAY